MNIVHSKFFFSKAAMKKISPKIRRKKTCDGDVFKPFLEL